MGSKIRGVVAGAWAALAVCLAGAGCQTYSGHRPAPPCTEDMPRELAKVSLPEYVVEPPDILLIDALRVVPLPPYRVEALDTLLIQVPEAPATAPVGGAYQVTSEGTVDFGPPYGAVSVIGKTLEEARAAIDQALGRFLEAKPKSSVALGQGRALQQIRGEHLVRPDGSVGLGVYGSVPVAGLTLRQVKEAVERHLSQILLRPEVSVDVAGFNSKVYYIIFDGAGFGQQLIRQPITGNETVLDALSLVNGLPAQSSRHRIWVARPAPPEVGADQILPVCWDAITKGGRPATNYQLLPGDRIYVHADPLIKTDNVIAKITAPIERVLGTILLSNAVVEAVQRGNQGGLFGGQ